MEVEVGVGVDVDVDVVLDAVVVGGEFGVEFNLLVLLLTHLAPRTSYLTPPED